MTRINSDAIQALAALMRAQVQALGRPIATSAPAAPVRGDGKAHKRGKSEDLAGRLARRVRAIDPSDPDAERQAMRVFLESVLLAEFGEHLINDSGFHQIVEGVYQQMRGNAELSGMMERAARALLAK
ncbi:MAG TPA: hypothetical protein VIP05_08160 [Burkholderiaceae bacterium]